MQIVGVVEYTTYRLADCIHYLGEHLFNAEGAAPDVLQSHVECEGEGTNGEVVDVSDKSADLTALASFGRLS